MQTALHQTSISPDRRQTVAAPRVLRLSEVRTRRLEWLWSERIPLGKLTLLAGDPGLGKSFLSLDLASRVSTGSAWPDNCHAKTAPGSVVLLSAEDDLEDTVCPRLQATGADLSKIVSLSAMRCARDGLARPLSLTRDLAAVRDAVAALPDCRLVVIDPISGYMGDADGNNNIDVRSLLFPLAELAAERRLAVVAITHLNKKVVGKAIYRAMGSLAFVAAARAAWGVICDPDDESRRLFMPLKHNLAPKVKGLSFAIQATAGHDTPHVVWDASPIDRSIDELLQAPTAFNSEAQDYRDRMGHTIEWLREQLLDGPIKRREIFFYGLISGHSEPQLYRAAEKLGVVKTKKGRDPDSWEWSLPAGE
jgi:putative DNA primase/helicase